MTNDYKAADLAHDISFAVFRVARLVRHQKLRKELEASAVDLVKNPDIKSIDSILGLVNLSESVGELSCVNANVLRRELNNLGSMADSAIAELPDALEEIDLNDFFNEKNGNNSGSESDFLNPEERQEAIAVFIRQFPDDCRMKDLISEFPDVSERTLRGDVQKLIETGLVERAGSRSGPLSYLRTVSAGDIYTMEEDSESGGKNAVDSILLSEPASGRSDAGGI